MPSEHDDHRDRAEQPQGQPPKVNAGGAVLRTDGGLSGAYTAIIGHSHRTVSVGARASDEQPLASLNNVRTGGVATQALPTGAVDATSAQSSQVVTTAWGRAAEEWRAER